MRLLGLLFCFIAAAVAAPGTDYYGLSSGGRVVGGEDAIPHEFPSIVSVQQLTLASSSHICGGSIINEQWILTAAHCITELPASTQFLILAGSHNITDQREVNRQIRAVDITITHPDYKGGVSPTDIAIMHMVSPLEFNCYVNKSNFPDLGQLFESGQATLAGWGSPNFIFPRVSPILQKVTKPLIDLATCKIATGGSTSLGPTNVCTGPLNDTVTACSGDSGGPLYMDVNGEQTQIGIVSWGFFPCGQRNRPSVYVAVACYRQWFENCIEGNCESTSNLKICPQEIVN